MSRFYPRQARYAVPVAVAGVIALVAWIPSLTAGASTPDLPAITAQQLIAQVDQAHVPTIQGTLSLTANLGFPDLSSLVGGDNGQVATSVGFEPTSLMSGTHSIELWADGDQERLALPRSMGETDFVSNGTQSWLYDSSTQHVTAYVPAPGTPAAAAPNSGAAAPASTPDQVAAKLLARLGPSTEVSTPVAAPDVAGQPVYLLVLSPQPGTPGAAETTLTQISISVDADNGLPLDVSFFAKGVTAPVLELGYSSVSFSTPSASNFAVPVGTSTSTTYLHPHVSPSTPSSGDSHSTVTGPPWAQVHSFAGGSKVATELSNGGIQAVTSAVSGTFGTGRLLQGNAVNALVLPSGQVLVGSVSPAALEAAAAAPSTAAAPGTAAPSAAASSSAGGS